MKRLVLFALLLVAIHPAWSAEPAKNCDMTLDAKKIDASVTGGKGGTASGNVVITRCEMKMRADTVNVTMAGGQTDKIIARGNVVLVSEKSGIVTADNGVYDVPRRFVTLTGRVVLKDGANVLTGTRGTYNLATGMAMVDAPSATPGVPYGRVRAVLKAPPEAGK